jgi:hypothetical protein
MILELLHILNNPHLYAVTLKNGELVIAPIDSIPSSDRVMRGHRRA